MLKDWSKMADRSMIGGSVMDWQISQGLAGWSGIGHELVGTRLAKFIFHCANVLHALAYDRQIGWMEWSLIRN